MFISFCTKFIRKTTY